MIISYDNMYFKDCRNKTIIKLPSGANLGNVLVSYAICLLELVTFECLHVKEEAPLAFDTLGAASVRSMGVINGLAQNIATRSHSSYSMMKGRFHQLISCAIWLTVATAILSRMPTHTTDVEHPIGA